MSVPDPGRTYTWVLRRAPVTCGSGNITGAGTAGAGLFNVGTTPIDITRVDVEYSYNRSNPVWEPLQVFRVGRTTSWSGGFDARVAERHDTNDSALPSGVRWVLSPTAATIPSAFRTIYGGNVTPERSFAAGFITRDRPTYSQTHHVRGSVIQGWVLRAGEGLLIWMPSTIVDSIPIPFRAVAIVKDGSGNTHTLTALITLDVESFGQSHRLAVLANPVGSGVTVEVVDLWLTEAAVGPLTTATKLATQSLALAQGWQFDRFSDGDELDVTSTIVPHDPAAPTPPVKAMRGPFSPLWLSDRKLASQVSPTAGTGNTGPASIKNLLACPAGLEESVPIVIPRPDRSAGVLRTKRGSPVRPIRLQPGIGLVLKGGNDNQSASPYHDALPNLTIEFTVMKPRRFHGVQAPVPGAPL